jgi:hypothetical protein
MKFADNTVLVLYAFLSLVQSHIGSLVCFFDKVSDIDLVKLESRI